MTLRRLSVISLLSVLVLSVAAQDAPLEPDPATRPATPSGEEGSQILDPESRISIYVIPVTDAISKPNLYILRRGLKEAIANEVDMVLIDMDTPGGR